MKEIQQIEQILQECLAGIWESGTVDYPDAMENDRYITLVVLLVGAVAFAVAPLALAWLWARVFSPSKPGPEKNAIYECGLESTGDAWIQFQPGYYLYAIVFLVFDVEAIFLLPMAVAFKGLSVQECVAALVFLLLLVEGLLWAYQKKVFDWS